MGWAVTRRSRSRSTSSMCRVALAVLATVPVLAMLLSAFLREPVQDEPVPAEHTPLTAP